MTFTRVFEHNGFDYVLSDAGYSADGRMVLFTKWNKKGQQMDFGFIVANTFTEAMYKIKGQ